MEHLRKANVLSSRLVRSVNFVVTILPFPEHPWQCAVVLLLDIGSAYCLALLAITKLEIGSSEEWVQYANDEFSNFIDWLQALIEWLMGNPAGLKLNRPLNETLGKFFLYHIYLWRTYITFVYPLLNYVAAMLRFSWILGLTFQLAFLSDLLSLLTIHIYCFHVYAARLYQLQINALMSLWRLFRGKKYNPLRNRVDTAECDTQQLFLGTLIFTVLIFLLPTVLVYYVVFSVLRLLIYWLKAGFDVIGNSILLFFAWISGFRQNFGIFGRNSGFRQKLSDHLIWPTIISLKALRGALFGALF